MKLSFWLKHKIGIKRWIFMGFLSLMFIICGMLIAVTPNSTQEKIILSLFFVLLGSVGIILAAIKTVNAIVKTINLEMCKGKVSSNEIMGKVMEKRSLSKGPKIVVVGGGTGLSTMLRGIKKYTSNITAIVTVADDGGGSGVLREDLGMLPPGDIRNCILALADTEPVMEELLQYRFKDGALKGQSFGNLFLAAMDGISDNFMEAVQKMSSVLAVTGNVLPVTLENVKIKAVLENGKVVQGESIIPSTALQEKSSIDKIVMEPGNAEALPEAVSAIMNADAVILGPGSLYTSVIPNLLVDGIRDALESTLALKMYVCNIMTQPGESDNYTVSDHVKALQNHGGKYIIDDVIVNTGEVSKGLRDKYLDKGSELVLLDKDKLQELGVGIIQGNFVKIKKGYLRHDTEKLSDIIMSAILEKNLEDMKSRAYLSSKLKEIKKSRE
ncbi:conserved hypothetical protein, cofD-related [Clostridium collagenovorans DSM 3089]|uniref:Putative gluconeogenesis factor n=1 Tax=Clostridium collagenovorans DSM 3089 TaxID=1121306 RepID=A0A1M5WYE8_9CLOT|nr:YvcK family protein [Clostridium collagenovorans]SHH92577.1 conserved hypothetical protein, cofD-related [Clostridium collagenovorans DSM 3089]